MVHHIPLNMALRDFNLEDRNAIANDAFAYESVRGLMISIKEIVEELGSAVGLDMYYRIFRYCNQEVLFQSENFLIQYDGLRKGVENQDQWRIIWRDVVIGWYKHPLRALEANRELGAAEKALMLKEFRDDFAKYLENRPILDASMLLDCTPSPMPSVQGLLRLNQKLMNNATVGAFVEATKPKDFMVHPHQQQMIDSIKMMKRSPEIIFARPAGPIVDSFIHIDSVEPDSDQATRFLTMLKAKSRSTDNTGKYFLSNDPLMGWNRETPGVAPLRFIEYSAIRPTILARAIKNAFKP